STTQNTQQASVPISLYHRAQEKIRALEQENKELKHELLWRDQLDRVPAQVISVSQKATLRAATTYLKGKKPDTEGYMKIETWKIGKMAGQSDQTVRDNLAYCSEQLRVFNKKLEREE